MNNLENGQKEFDMEQKHSSRKKKKAGTVKKIVIIALSAVVILGGAAALIINHYLNKIQKINVDEETTLSPSEFWELIGIDPSDQATDSLESSVETEPETTEEETVPPETTETETEQESATEDTERLIILDPDATDVVGIKETTTTAPTTKWTPPPTTTQPKPTTPAYVPNNYNWTKAPGLGDDYLINILLIGDDSRSTDGRSRSDTIMLLSINPKTNKASLITFMRDMYVPIHDGYGSSRINHAYEAGGVGFLTECLQMNFGLHIDGVVRINFWGFVKAVDILGGVDVSMTENEVKMMKAYYVDYSGKGLNESMIHTGNCHFDGNAALAYCRIRSLDNDYNRTARQRKVLTTLFNKVKNSDAGTLQNLANSVLSCCQTTMSNGTMAGYLAQLAPKAKSINLQSYRLPVANSFRDVVISGQQVLQSDQSKNIAALKSYLPW